jgi:hypothetical protein
MLFTGIRADASHTPTNMTVIANALGKAIDVSVDELDRQSASRTCAASRRILIGELEQHEANWLVSHILADRLIHRGFEVYRNATPEGCHETLSYRVAELVLNASGNLRGGDVTRTARVELAMRLTTGSADSLLWRDEASVTLRDDVPPSALEVVQNDEYSFAKFELAEQSWNRFVQPVVVSSVLGVLVYLFFSNR